MEEQNRFFDVFPDLHLEGTVVPLFEGVRVQRVVTNAARTRLRIMVTSENWIKKKHIRKVENAIKSQLFKGQEMDARIIEKFDLPSVWTPSLFFDAYRSSMEYELREVSPLMLQAFLHSAIEFDEGGALITVEENPIYKWEEERIISYIGKIFRDRAGFADFEVRVAHVSAGPASFDDDLYLAEAAHTESAAEEKAEKKGGEENAAADKGKGKTRQRGKLMPDNEIVLGRNFDDEPSPLAGIEEAPGQVTIKASVFFTEQKEAKNERFIFTVYLTDGTDSIKLKLWCGKEDIPDYEKVFGNGASFVIKGFVDYDKFDKEFVIKSIIGVKKTASLKAERTDNEPEKRTELHCHTQMSDMDAVSSATAIIKQAYKFGMKAIAITDHGVVQAFPEAHKAFGGKKGIPKDADLKVIYGMEAYLVDDTRHIVSGGTGGSLMDDIVIFQTVTTGLSPATSMLIELSAVKIRNGSVDEEFSTLVRPGSPIPFSIQQETGITDDMVSTCMGASEAIARFVEFAGDLPLAAYDADQEMNYLIGAGKKCGVAVKAGTVVDIAEAARIAYPELGRIRFRTLVRHFKLSCDNEMRAQPRTACLATIWTRIASRLAETGMETFEDLNESGRLSKERVLNMPYYHAIILAKNETGRRNLYTLVSLSHLEYFKRRPRIPRSVLNRYREGLILGSACSAGELYRAILTGASDSEIARIVNYYDYLEIQPTANNNYLIGEAKSGVSDEEDLRKINREIVKLGEEFGKPVCATCDVHFLNPEDWIYRAIIQAGHGFDDEYGGQPPLFLRTTREMLDEFAYLGSAKCREVVIENPAKIAERVEKISPIYPDKCPPEIPDSDNELRRLCYDTAHGMYGEELPEAVSSRLEKELGSIISNGYAVMYIIAQRLVQRSMEDGYIVGSRGSVGSSFAATMAGITEINPLPPHYRCPECKYSDFDSETVKAARRAGLSGCDMQRAVCPVCGAELIKDGFDIPFETFLGFKGDKEPDIDLNFSGEEQGVAQAYTEVIFGKGQTFKAGTIGTVAEKTAIGYAKKYFEQKGITKRGAELKRLSDGCVGVRRTTGQHPGGVIVLPKGMDINWFTPVQHPANDTTSPFITTHFDYHSIDANLLKLDILGHDDPTMIRMLGDLTGTDPLTVPLDDEGVLSLFTGTEALGIKPADIGGCALGTLGIPEFGTNFVIGMLKDTKPSNFSELIKISGLSHGTDVWVGNAQEFIRAGECTLGTAICTRDDIMLYLIEQGLEPERAFKIMESVRKGKGLTPDDVDVMEEQGVPEWYIESCRRIKYMFPKAHAAAYVMNAFRIAYYKIYHPLAYYAAFFSVRAKTFDYAHMCRGLGTLNYYEGEIKRKESLTARDEDELDDMKLVREMYARGYDFIPPDIYRSGATKCQIVDGKILPPLNSVNGLGDSQAAAIEAEAAKSRFLSKDDLRERTHVSKTTIETLEELGILKDMPESNQISMFDFI